MAKRKLPQEVFGETDDSDEDFYFGLPNTDSDRESDNYCSDSAVICAINSYILYKVSARRESRKPMPHFMFVRKLVAQLVGNFRGGADSKPGRPSTSDKDERLNGKLHILRHCENVKSKDCTVCSNRKIKGGRHQTNYFCDTCTQKPGLHVGECFEKYHTKENYKT